MQYGKICGENVCVTQFSCYNMSNIDVKYLEIFAIDVLFFAQSKDASHELVSSVILSKKICLSHYNGSKNKISTILLISPWAALLL